MWRSREIIINLKSKLDVKQQTFDSMRTECIIMLSCAQKSRITACSFLCRGFVPYLQPAEHCVSVVCPVVLGPLLSSLGPWLEGAVVPFTRCVLLFFPGNQRCRNGRETPLCAWGSAPSEVGFSWGASMVQEFRIIFGLEWTLQPLSGSS